MEGSSKGIAVHSVSDNQIAPVVSGAAGEGATHA